MSKQTAQYLVRKLAVVLLTLFLVTLLSFLLDYLVYDPERLVCTDQEKDACLETVRKLVRLCYEIRRNGVLSPLFVAEKEQDPFLRACMLELGFDEGFITREGEPARLERVFAAYLAAGNYRGGDFLNAVLVTKGLMFIWKNVDEHPAVQAKLLSVELRGFFGIEYRAQVIAAVKQEIRSHASRPETSVVPAFDELARLSLVQRQSLLQNVDACVLDIALRGAGAAVEDALVEALDDEKRAELEPDRRYAVCYRDAEIGQVQNEILKLKDEIL